MSLINFFHRTVCRAIPEMSAVDAGASNAITAAAVKNIPFKDKRNWFFVLLLLVYEIPFFIYLFFGDELAARRTSNNVMFVASIILGFALLPICWFFMLRVIRPELLAILMPNKAISCGVHSSFR